MMLWNILIAVIVIAATFTVSILGSRMLHLDTAGTVVFGIACGYLGAQVYSLLVDD